MLIKQKNVRHALFAIALEIPLLSAATDVYYIGDRVPQLSVMLQLPLQSETRHAETLRYYKLRTGIL